MKKILTALSVLLLIPVFMQAQSDEDALRYSQLTYGGTARFLSLSGAFGALGADFSSLSVNPAGLGLYRSGEFSFSPAITGIHSKASLNGTVSSNGTYPFNISNLGFVFTSDLTRKNPDNKWKRLNFGFGLNRQNDFNKEVYFNGFNNSTSMVDHYVEQANSNGGVDPNSITGTYPFGAGLFYQAYLINPTSGNPNFYDGIVENGNVQQSGIISEDGSNTEYLFSMGSNYDDKLMLGATLGLPSFYFNSYTAYTESDVNDIHSDFSSFSKYDYLHTHAYGIVGKFGMSYILNDYFRVGAAIHTPTIYWMHDDYNSSISSSLDQTGNYSWDSPFGSYDYELVTPWRSILSAAFMFGKGGFISADYELVDYNSMHYNFNRFASPDEITIENNLNQTIDLKYKMGQNIKVGAEIAQDQFRFRLGGAYYGSPFESGIATGDSDFSRWSFSGGFGVRGNHFYFDAAYVYTLAKEFYQPYTLSNVPVQGVAIDKNTNNVVATLGYKF